MRVIAKRGIGAKAQLVLVEIDGSRYVLGVTDGGVSVIDRLDPESARTTSVAPVTALPMPAPAPAAVTVASAAPLDPHALPLRRTHPQSRAAARAVRSGGLSTFLQKDAAQVLRRALGA